MMLRRLECGAERRRNRDKIKGFFKNRSFGKTWLTDIFKKDLVAGKQTRSCVLCWLLLCCFIINFINRK